MNRLSEVKTRHELRDDYQNRRDNFSSILKGVKEEITLFSNLRLVAAVIILILIYYALQNPELFVVVALFVGLFFSLVKKHAKLFEQRDHLQNLVKINQSEKDALSGQFTGLPSGSEFINPVHPFTHDLDVFGDGSLFQYLNRATTRSGKIRLAAQLSSVKTTQQEIQSIQEAVRDLAPRIEFRQHFQAAGMEAKEEAGDVEQIAAWLKHPPVINPNNPAWRIALIVVPLLTLIALIGTVFSENLRVFLFPMIIVQWILGGIYIKRIGVFHDYISRKKNILQKYSQLLYYVAQEKFNSARMVLHGEGAHEAHRDVKQLASLVNALDARTNFLAAAFVNSFLLYDLQCVYRLEKWKVTHSDRLMNWLESISEVETLNSFGTFCYNHPDFTFPSITDQIGIHATAMGHPLIDDSERIANDFSIGPAPSVHIITGANMAGKSTFLRTLGVNVMLALNGAPVCATSFICPIIEMRSGMRTADSLKDHQSYFFAELNRLKGIMDELRSDRPLLILLDEILKGTNSNDKQAGSIALVKQLLPHPCLALIATHDLALGQLEHEYPEQVKNYCFEANIENDQLSFDYKLKAGLAHRMNASFLMKKMGIIP